MNHPYLAPGQDVNYVDTDRKMQKGKITQVINADTADIAYGGNHAAVAPYSDKKEPGTFHFADASAKPEQPTEAKK